MQSVRLAGLRIELLGQEDSDVQPMRRRIAERFCAGNSFAA
jgi:hypothetical protein